MSYDFALLEADLRADLMVDEGDRLRPYKDSRGFVSIGIGRNLSTEGISQAEASYLLANDIAGHTADLDRAFPWWRGLDEPRGRVLANLCFNLGIAKLQEFGGFLDRLRAHDYPGAANDLKTTAWYAEVGTRGPRMIQRLLA
jgi:lysozyme